MEFLITRLLSLECLFALLPFCSVPQLVKPDRIFTFSLITVSVATFLNLELVLVTLLRFIVCLLSTFAVLLALATALRFSFSQDLANLNRRKARGTPPLTPLTSRVLCRRKYSRKQRFSSLRKPLVWGKMVGELTDIGNSGSSVIGKSDKAVGPACRSSLKLGLATSPKDEDKDKEREPGTVRTVRTVETVEIDYCLVYNC